MNRNERSAYMSKELVATERQDLIDAVENAEISLKAALRIAKPEKYDRKSVGLQSLILAWRMADENEREEFRKLI